MSKYKFMTKYLESKNTKEEQTIEQRILFGDFSNRSIFGGHLVCRIRHTYPNKLSLLNLAAPQSMNTFFLQKQTKQALAVLLDHSNND